MPQTQRSDKSEPRPNVKENNLNEVVAILIFLGSPKKNLTCLKKYLT